MKHIVKFDSFLNESTDEKSLKKDKSCSDGTGYAYDELEKIVKAIDKDLLKIYGGKRKWKKYTLDIHELSWSRNNQTGYEMSVYMQNTHGREEHIGDITNGKITPECDNFSFQRYVLGKEIDDIKFEEE